MNTVLSKALIVSILGLSGFVVMNSTTFLHTPTAYNLEYDNPELGHPIIPKNNPMTVEGVTLGRFLFYDPILSSDSDMSCGSCHRQVDGFTDGRKLAIGTYGDTLSRNTMSLINLAWSDHLFWDGRANTLEQLVVDPLTNPIEMAADTNELKDRILNHPIYPSLFSEAFPGESISVSLISKAISQFLRTIISNGLDADYMFFEGISDIDIEKLVSESDVVNEASLRGSFVRLSEMCSPCHGGAVYGNGLMSNNALGNSQDRFKVPSLLNVTLTGPYMHDGRFSSLNDVMNHYRTNYGLLQELNPDIEITSDNLLTDYDIENAEALFAVFQDANITSNERYSDPFDGDFNWSDWSLQNQ